MSTALIGGNILSGSRSTMAGVKNFLIARTTDVASISRFNGSVTITMNTGRYFMKYECARNSSSFNEDFEYRRETGQEAVTQSAVLAINNMNTKWRVQVKNMAKKPCYILIQDRTGLWWLMGETGGVMIDKVSSSLGQQGTDRRGMVVNFRADETDLAPNATVTEGVHYLNDQNNYLQDVDGTFLEDIDGSLLEDAAVCPTNPVLSEFSNSDFNSDFNI